jgi:hypothetical protein
MKLLLIIFSLIVLNNSISYSAEIENCSNYSKLSPKFYKCKTGNFVTDTKNYQKKVWADEKKKVDKMKKKVLKK